MLSKLRLRLVHWRKHGARNHVVDFGKVIALEEKYPRNVIEMEKKLMSSLFLSGSFCGGRLCERAEGILKNACFLEDNTLQTQE